MSSSQSPQNSNADSSSSAKPFSLSLGGNSTKAPANGQPKKTSFNIQGAARSTDSPSRTLARRPHHLHDDEESDEEAAPTHEAVTGFDTLTGTAIPANKVEEKRELVIPVAGNNNWRDRPGVNLRKPKGKNLLPKEVQAIQEAQKRGEVAGDNVETERPSMAYGLSFAQPASQDSAQAADNDRPMKDVTEPAATPAAEVEPKPLTQDEIALQALIRETKGEPERRSDLVIESVNRDDDDRAGGRYDETSSFRADVAARPESASLDQYNAIPVEEFGAALLRGMGWKEGQAVGRGKYGGSANQDNKPRVPERRPGFLGIGAKDVSGGKGAEAELGAWGKAAMRKGSRKGGKEGESNPEGVYMPIMMRNKQTGEFITEEELAAQRKEAKKRGDDDEWKQRRDRNLEKSGHGGPDLQGETGVCHPVTGIQDGADTKMKIARVVMTATTGTETVTGIVTIAGIVIEMEIGNESVTGTEIGIGTAADGIVMMIAIVAQGILRRIHRVDIVTGIGSETVIATPAGEGETMIDESGKTWPAFHLSIS
ncbi:DExH-box splicing factor binding site-domain-containing protein [Aspergillus welwitschiae]|uniref:Pre-mRNA-splicing factor n=1 Tax=Aspergillus welwitschiae TaxID=1341132 RepID=A0A3F3Q4I0_9EURO|nr:DExH-box splicing factor binding site-domain-containing protein [Aspergillus welwitschiae]RDH34119.1 DExH-box splicing factor binding site-domain-containing protein [Aspergillus welwitschiae]